MKRDDCTDIMEELTTTSKKFAYFLLAINESTEMTSIAQLLIYMRGVTHEFKVSEELIEMSS